MNIKGLKLTKEGKDFFEKLEKLNNYKVTIGIKSGEGNEGGTDLADIAAYNEFGTSTTPPRPFLRQGIEKSTDKIFNIVKQGISGGEDIETVLEAVGEAGAESVKEEINSGSFAPNAESTIKKKGSSKPLIDTGAMLNAIKYYIEKE